MKILLQNLDHSNSENETKNKVNLLREKQKALFQPIAGKRKLIDFEYDIALYIRKNPIEC